MTIVNLYLKNKMMSISGEFNRIIVKTDEGKTVEEMQVFEELESDEESSIGCCYVGGLREKIIGYEINIKSPVSNIDMAEGFVIDSINIHRIRK